jgi:hypothetical protein
MFKVGYATEGHSEYEDYIWNWLRKRRRFFPDCAGYDYAGAWGLFLIAGCIIESQDDDRVYKITFPGTRFLLLKRLNRLFDPEA